MPDRWIGIVVASANIVVVDALVPDIGPIQIQADHSWPLQSGARPAAYSVMHQQVGDYVREHGIQRVVIKATALSTAGTKMSHMEAAELRGVVICSAATVVPTQLVAKAHMSRTFGSRKVDEYIADSRFWSTEISGAKLRTGSREAAMILLAARKTP